MRKGTTLFTVGFFGAAGFFAACRTAPPADDCNWPVSPPAQPLRLDVVRKVPPHTFVALVLDRTTNQPVETASVSFYVPGEPGKPAVPRGAFTDSTGVVQVPELPVGVHEITIRRLGYVIRKVRIEITDTAAVMGAFALERQSVFCNAVAPSRPTASVGQTEQPIRLVEHQTPAPAGTRLAIQFNDEAPVIRVDDGRGGPPFSYHGQDLSPGRIKSIRVLHTKEARERFGDQTLDGAILIEVK